MLQSFALAALLGASSALAAAAKCGVGNKCPKDTPCCSQYGECGIGAYCLGGCDPLTSFSLDSCVPAPTCKDKTLKFGSLDNVKNIAEYLGDSDKADWVVSGEPVLNGGNTLLTMPKGSVGTVMSSTTYMWYGNVKARLKTSRGSGVVTAFILFSDVKDEIDFEWIGTDLGTTQTNFYFQGITNYQNSANTSVTDSFNNFHDYELRWTPDKIEWWIDGKLGRTKERKDTWNATSQNWGFPQTPSRVQLSLWPGGLETNPQGTIDWAGGKINWDAEDIKKVGFFYAEVESVTIECYDGSNGIGTNKGKSYYYKDLRGTNDTVVDGDKDHIIASLQATGLDMTKGKKDDTNTDKDKDKDKDTEDKQTIPGGSTGSPGKDHSDENNSTDTSSGDNSSSSGGNNNSNCADGDFCQGTSTDSTTDSTKGGSAKSSASALAIIIAGFALYWL
ncbi:hypothetical protein V2G26_017806 [Clonostachys chloroleuca]|uniref:Crh-like protein n=1 Tax=Clonostachys chloroleuca TaxID=1926264 RepID=A0AA35MA81_9HYPO|nr:unnamed protein product [Clonostachys chloroleuca]